jgi:hypothetical protein
MIAATPGDPRQSSQNHFPVALSAVLPDRGSKGIRQRAAAHLWPVRAILNCIMNSRDLNDREPCDNMTIKTFRAVVFNTASCFALLVMPFENMAAQRSESPIRIGWWRGDKELYADVFRPTQSNSCEVAVAVQGRILNGPVVMESLPKLLSLVKQARQEVDPLKPVGTSDRSQMRRLVMEYEMDGRHTFSLQAPLPDMLRSFEKCAALRQLFCCVWHPAISRKTIGFWMSRVRLEK